MKAGVAQYDAALAQYGATLAGLQAVPAAVAGKENSVAEDSRVLAAAGMQLEESCRQLEGLMQQKAAAERGGGGGANKDGEPARRVPLLSRCFCGGCWVAAGCWARWTPAVPDAYCCARHVCRLPDL